MLTRLFNQSLPPPTEEQLQTMLFNIEIGLSSEIISASYEPRFKLYALGSSTGSFYVINDKNYCYSYIPLVPDPPVLKIIPLTNSSTFLSVSSNSLFENHCFKVSRQNRPEEINNIFYKNKTILSEITLERSKSNITHWIITHDGKILHRTISLKYDILDFAASPLHPEFVLLMTKTGSIYGFSVEEMKFTELYLNVFEGQNVHSIICPFDMKFYICHDIVEKIDMSNKEISKGPQINASQIDIIDEKSGMTAAIHSQQKIPSLFKGNRPVSSIPNLDGSIGTFASLISNNDWTSIVHSYKSDSIYLNDQIKLQLEDEMLVPSIVVEYQKPLTREGPRSVTFFTSTGRFLDLNGKSVDHFMLKPIEPKFSYIDKNDNIYVFNVTHHCFIFERSNYVGSYPFSWGKPLAILNGFALCVSEEKELFIVNVKNDQKVELNSPLLPSPIVSHQLFESHIDFLCEGGKVIRIDLSSKEKFEGEEVVDDQELSVYSNFPSNSQEVKFWRPFNGTFACIKYDKSKPVLTVDKYTSNEVCEKNEGLVYFDVIDDSGKVTATNGSYILTVSTYHISIFAIDKKGLRRIRHASASRSPIVEASVTSWGVLIVRSKEGAKLYALPDISFDPIAQLSFDYDAPPPHLKPAPESASAPASAPPSSDKLELELPETEENRSLTLPALHEVPTDKKKASKQASKEAKKAKKAEKAEKKKKADKKDKKDKKDKDDKIDSSEKVEITDSTEQSGTQKSEAEEAANRNAGENENEDDNCNNDNEAAAPSDEDIIENIQAVNPIVLPHKGLIIFERNLVTIYLRKVDVPPCFDEDKLPEVLVPPPVTGLKKLFGKKSTMTLEEADRYFLFNRNERPNIPSNNNANSNSGDDSNNAKPEDTAARAAGIGGALLQTQELMQQLLVKANERGDQLNELEIKAQRLLKSAKQYNKNARQFRH